MCQFWSSNSVKDGSELKLDFHVGCMLLPAVEQHIVPAKVENVQLTERHSMTLHEWHWGFLRNFPRFKTDLCIPLHPVASRGAEVFHPRHGKCFTTRDHSLLPDITHLSISKPKLRANGMVWLCCVFCETGWSGRSGWSGWFGCAPACVVQAGRDGQDGRDGFAVLQHVWYRLVGTVGTVGMVGMVRILLRAQKFRFYHSDSTIPISTTRFRFYHSDFDNTHLSICLSVHMSIYLPIDICMYVCMYVYIYISTHTYSFWHVSPVTAPNLTRSRCGATILCRTAARTLLHFPFNSASVSSVSSCCSCNKRQVATRCSQEGLPWVESLKI